MERLLLQREVGGYTPSNERPWSKVHNDISSNENLISRLVNHKHVDCETTSGALSWSDCGTLLAIAGDDCALRLYNADKATILKFDPGHTEPLTCAEFLPGTRGRMLVTAGPSKDIRVVDIERQAVRPYTGHASTIRSLLPISQAVFASGGEDGTIRCFDYRTRESRDTSSQSSNLLVDQRHEGVARLGARPSVLSMSQDPVNTQYIATGGGDALVRVYDLRMMWPPNSSRMLTGYNRTNPPPWCYCLAPTHMRNGSTDRRITRGGSSISSVAFDSTGRRLLAGYAAKEIYSFDVRLDGCSYPELYNPQRPQAAGTGLQQQLQEGHRRASAASPAGTTSAGTSVGRRATRNRRTLMGGVWPGTATVAQPAANTGRNAAAAQPAAAGARRSSGRRTVRPLRGASSRQPVAATTNAMAQQADADAVLTAAGPAEQVLEGAAAIAEAEVAAAGAALAAAQPTAHGPQSRARIQQLRDRLQQLQQARDELLGDVEQLQNAHDAEQRDADGQQQHSNQASDNSDEDMDDDGAELILAAEVHIVGPDGTVLHTTRLPLHRAPLAASQQLLGAATGRRRASPAGDARDRQDGQGPNASTIQGEATRLLLQRIRQAQQQDAPQRTASEQTIEGQASMQQAATGQASRDSDAQQQQQINESGQQQQQREALQVSSLQHAVMVQTSGQQPEAQQHHRLQALGLQQSPAGQMSEQPSASEQLHQQESHDAGMRAEAVAVGEASRQRLRSQLGQHRLPPWSQQRPADHVFNRQHEEQPEFLQEHIGQASVQPHLPTSPAGVPQPAGMSHSLHAPIDLPGTAATSMQAHETTAAAEGSTAGRTSTRRGAGTGRGRQSAGMNATQSRQRGGQGRRHSPVVWPPVPAVSQTASPAAAGAGQQQPVLQRRRHAPIMWPAPSAVADSARLAQLSAGVGAAQANANRAASSTTAAGSRGRGSARTTRACAGPGFVFMGLGGEHAGSTHDIADISPSVLQETAPGQALMQREQQSASQVPFQEPGQLLHHLHQQGYNAEQQEELGQDRTAKRARLGEDGSAADRTAVAPADGSTAPYQGIAGNANTAILGQALTTASQLQTSTAEASHVTVSQDRMAVAAAAAAAAGNTTSAHHASQQPAEIVAPSGTLRIEPDNHAAVASQPAAAATGRGDAGAVATVVTGSNGHNLSGGGLPGPAFCARQQAAQRHHPYAGLHRGFLSMHPYAHDHGHATGSSSRPSMFAAPQGAASAAALEAPAMPAEVPATTATDHRPNGVLDTSDSAAAAAVAGVDAGPDGSDCVGAVNATGQAVSDASEPGQQGVGRIFTPSARPSLSPSTAATQPPQRQQEPGQGGVESHPTVSAAQGRQQTEQPSTAQQLTPVQMIEQNIRRQLPLLRQLPPPSLPQPSPAPELERALGISLPHPRRAGGAVMLCAELKLPHLTREQAERQLHRRRQQLQQELARPRQLEMQEEVGHQRIAAEPCDAVLQQPASNHQVPAAAATAEAAAASACKLSVQPEQQYQAGLQELQQPGQQRVRRGKRKRSGGGTMHAEPIPAATPERSAAAEPTAGSDAAYVSAIAGATHASNAVGISRQVATRRSSRLARTVRSAAASEAAANSAPAAATGAGTGQQHTMSRKRYPQAASAAAAAVAGTAVPSAAGASNADAGGRQGNNPFNADANGPPPVEQVTPSAPSWHSDAGLGTQFGESSEDDFVQVDPGDLNLDGQEPATSQQPHEPQHAAEGGVSRLGAAGVDYHDRQNDETAAAHTARGYSCCYRGHLNTVASRNAVWLGAHGEYVVSGSDDGCLYVWAADTGELVAVLKGGDKAVKRVQVNSHQLLLASCGSESAVRLWSPEAEAASSRAAAAATMAATQAAAAEEEADRQAAMGGLMGMLRQIGERLVWGLLGGDREQQQEQDGLRASAERPRRRGTGAGGNADAVADTGNRAGERSRSPGQDRAELGSSDSEGPPGLVSSSDDEGQQFEIEINMSDGDVFEGLFAGRRNASRLGGAGASAGFAGEMGNAAHRTAAVAEAGTAAAGTGTAAARQEPRPRLSEVSAPAAAAPTRVRVTRSSARQQSEQRQQQAAIEALSQLHAGAGTTPAMTTEGSGSLDGNSAGHHDNHASQAGVDALGGLMHHTAGQLANIGPDALGPVGMLGMQPAATAGMMGMGNAVGLPGGLNMPDMHAALWPPGLGDNTMMIPLGGGQVLFPGPRRAGRGLGQAQEQQAEQQAGDQQQHQQHEVGERDMEDE